MVTPTIEYIAAWATAATAVGTIVLAIATYLLALRTNTLAKDAEAELKIVTDQATAAQRQSEIAEEALAASIRPLLANVVAGTVGPRKEGGALKRVDDASLIIWGTGDHFELIIPVCNVGPGVARLRLAVLTANRQYEGAGPLLKGRIPAVIAANGAIDLIEFTSEDDPDGAAGALARLVQSDMEMVLEVLYHDVSQRASVTQFVMVRVPDTNQLVINDVIPLGPQQYTVGWPRMFGGVVLDAYLAQGTGPANEPGNP